MVMVETLSSKDPLIIKWPLVSVIIVNYNGLQHLESCIESVLKSSYPNLEIIVVDNASVDGSVQLIKQRFPRLTLIKNKSNLGFAAGVNVGIRSSKGEFIFLLNNDAMIAESCVEELVRVALGDPNIGILGCKIYFPKGRVLQHAGGMIYRSGKCGHLGHGEIDFGQYNLLREVDYVTGAALMITHRALDEVGMMDPLYFLYYDDVEWCYKAHEKGFKVVYAPSAVVYHHESASTLSQIPVRNYNMHKSRIIFVVKNLTWDKVLFLIIAELVYFIKALGKAAASRRVISVELIPMLKAYFWTVHSLPRIMGKRLLCVVERYL